MIGRAVRLLALWSALVLAGCASAPREPAARAEFRANNDPLEPLNRETFQLNLFIDRWLIKPLALGYRHAVPEVGRNAIRHFLDNLNEPIVLINDLLQARLPAAATTGGRFLVNTTAGAAGFADVASRHGLAKQSGDFGQTLSTWGFSEGPYLVLPLLGPSSPRDGVGWGVDSYLDPFRYVARANHYPTAFTLGRIILDGVDRRERAIDALDEMQHEAVDYYASFRSLYRQNRAAELKPAGAATTTPASDFYNDPGK